MQRARLLVPLAAVGVVCCALALRSMRRRRYTLLLRALYSRVRKTRRHSVSGMGAVTDAGNGGGAAAAAGDASAAREEEKQQGKETTTPEYAVRSAFFKQWVGHVGLRLRGVMQRVQREEKEVRVIHVAGTKGKGSVCEYVRCLLQNAQQPVKVGSFTSPHMHSARERIRINDECISMRDFVRIGEAVAHEMLHVEWVVFFDMILAMALQYFSEQDVDWIVLETGIGGRFDSTNFVPQPDACVITSISYDHIAILGDSLEDIAWQKAGIIKPHVPVFTCQSQPPEVLQVLRTVARDQHAPFEVIPCVGEEDLDEEDSDDDDDKSAAGKDARMVSAQRRAEDMFWLQALALPGSVQQENMSLALAAVRSCGCRLQRPVARSQFSLLPRTASASSTAHAFAHRPLVWPCRFECFDLPGDRVVVVDGAHNHYSVRRLFADLEERYKGRDLYCMFGAGAGKDVDRMLVTACAHAQAVTLVLAQIIVRKAVPATELVNHVPEPLRDVALWWPLPDRTSSINATLRAMLRDPRTRGNVIVACGSFFVAAEAREALVDLAPTQFPPSDWVHMRDVGL